MRPRFLWGTLLAIITLAAYWNFQTRFSDRTIVYDPPLRHVEAAPLCPWREPENDQRRFFPRATGHATETRILSGLRVELQKHLGRLPEPDENILVRHRVLANSESMGFILTRRVKGEHGAIEVVLAVNAGGTIEGVSLQRLREPEAIAKELRNQVWLNLFRGRTFETGWNVDDLRDIPDEARVSAGAVREGVRSLLILHAAADGKIS